MDLNKEKNVLYYTIGDYMEITNKDIENIFENLSKISKTYRTSKTTYYLGFDD